MDRQPDFSGWATVNNLKCTDGRTIRKDAFKDCHGSRVPLVWNHQHDDPSNVLGHADLENCEQGVFARCYFNNSESGKVAKECVNSGDISSLSIWANKLRETSSGDVLHGSIKEVSLVLAGANPGARITSVALAHGEMAEDEAIIWTGEELYLEHTATTDPKTAVTDDEMVEDINDDYSEEPKEVKKEIKSKKKETKKMKNDSFSHADEERTLEDVFNEMTDEQKAVVYALVGETAMMDENEGDEKEMKHNVFENEHEENVLSHSDMQAIFDDARRCGSLKESCLAHGIEDIDILFPDAQSVDATPQFIKRKDEWVDEVMNATHHTPFSRIKSLFADITEADARARGYIKGNYKVEEVFSLLKRTTDPTTIYKKQKLDRDDVVDITDFDVVAWLKSEMRDMLSEEIARAILIGDGRSSASNDKISENHIRPIWTDEDLFTIKKLVPVSATATDEVKAKSFIRAAIKARKDYRGSGNPVLFCTEDLLTDCLLIEDGMGRIIYDSVEKLATAMRVRKIVTVPVMEGATRNVGSDTRSLMGIIVNLNDYNVGSDKGGSVTMFDDFDIDYNAQKYLMETRISGALTKPYSAIVLEQSYSLTLTVAAEDNTTTVLGKLVSDLQSDLIVNDEYISGTLKYVTGYTGYSGDPALQEGNFMALKFEATEGATTIVELLGGHGGPVTLDSDMNCVLRIENNSQKVKVVTSLEGKSITKTYSLRGLHLSNK